MRPRAQSQGGFTLVEMIVVSALFLVVLTATLTSTGTFNRLNVQNQRLNDQTDRARQGVDLAVRQLRNLARRIEAPVIARAAASDFIFQTSDPERTWVRYCLQTRTDGRVWLWGVSSPNAVTAAMSGPCPGTGWAGRNAIATNITNLANGRTLPLFTYTCVRNAPAGCPATADDFSRIRSVGMDLFLDDNLAVNPPEVRVSSAIFLRNQNEQPTASFVSRPNGTRKVILNASASFDPEGRNLRFLWFRAPAPSFTCDIPAPADLLLWSGVTLNHTFLPTDGASGAQVPMELVVCDPGGLQARFSAQVTIP
jgi:prepilin-type N-terminal cleavage/methylation domain-containing protein